MNPNHKPNWQDWTPPECIDYWKTEFSDLLKEHNEFIQAYFQNTGIQILPKQSRNDFANDYQSSTLYKIEKLLTVPESKQVWDKVKKLLNLSPYEFVLMVQLSLNGDVHVDYAKDLAAWAATVQNKTTELLELLKPELTPFFILKSGSIELLNNLLAKTNACIEEYEQEKKLLSTANKKDAEMIYFIRKLTQQLRQQTGQPAHNLVKNCTEIIFSEKIKIDRVKKLDISG